MTSTYFRQQAYQQSRVVLAREALQSALRVRQRLGIKLWDAVCAHDIAQRLGIEVTFQNFPSMEGMYIQSSGTPLIVLGSERPAGRQNFSCAHEIGHHEHGDGTRVDEFLDDAHYGEARHQKKFDPIEFRADRFASFLLMPKSAVDRAFAVRQLRPADCEPEAIYAVAACLGVGYRTLIEHLCYSLRSISASRASELRRAALPRLRASIAGTPVKNVKIVDEHWGGHPIDVLVGDGIVAPTGWQTMSDCLSLEGETGDGVWKPGVLLRATRQGEGILSGDGKAIRVRIARQGFAGRAMHRHLYDPDEDLQGDDSTP